MNCKLLVCMTTTPQRLRSGFICRVLDSILAQQTSCAFRIVLFVPHHSLRAGAPYPDPAFLGRRYSAEQLLIHRCEDMGPATKFLGLLGLLPGIEADLTHIYIADDDIILRDHVFAKILQTLKARSAVRDWQRLVLANDAGVLHGMATVAGYAGILLPLGFMRSVAADARLAPLWADLAAGCHPCFNVDDMLLAKLIRRFGYEVEGTGLNPFVDVMDRASTDEHPDWFELCKHTARHHDMSLCFREPLP